MENKYREGKFRVLLTDDEEFQLFTMSTYLKMAGFEVMKAKSPSEAIELFKHHSFDAVVSDVIMEPIDGFMFRDMIRSLNTEIAIIFMTSVVNDKDNSLLTRIMMDANSYYVPKGPDRIILTNKLKQVIHHYRTQCKVSQLQQEIAANEEIASNVQFSMLPPWVRIEKDYLFSSIYMPLGKISGDLYEWIPIGEHKCLSVFGDISGHGTHSALGMTAVQTHLKSMAMYSEKKISQPHLIVQEINDFLCKHLHNSVYMCGMVVFWDFENKIVRYHNAGYMDMMILNMKTGEILDQNPEHKGSCPMGMFAEAEYNEQNTVEVKASEDLVFLCCSDGIWDMSRDEDGNEPVDQALAREMLSIMVQDSSGGHPSISLPYRCYDSLVQIGYTHPQDDCSMFAIRMLPPNAEDTIFIRRVAPNNESIDEICQEAGEYVMNKLNSLEMSTKVELLLEEHLVNIIDHGFDDFRKASDYIVIKVIISDTFAKVTILDRGNDWQEGMKVMSSDPDAVLEKRNQEYSDSGRGMAIVMKISPMITRQRHGGLNETVFHIPLN